jgi:phosphoglycolate phosphatase-like HAD superfamily hydrolase
MGRRAGLGLKVGVTTGTSPRAALAPHADVVMEGLGELLRIEGMG